MARVGQQGEFPTSTTQSYNQSSALCTLPGRNFAARQTPASRAASQKEPLVVGTLIRRKRRVFDQLSGREAPGVVPGLELIIRGRHLRLVSVIGIEMRRRRLGVEVRIEVLLNLEAGSTSVKRHDDVDPLPAFHPAHAVQALVASHHDQNAGARCDAHLLAESPQDESCRATAARLCPCICLGRSYSPDTSLFHRRKLD